MDAAFSLHGPRVPNTDEKESFMPYIHTTFAALAGIGLTAGALIVGTAARANALAWPHSTCEARTYEPDATSLYRFKFDHSDGNVKYFKVWMPGKKMNGYQVPDLPLRLGDPGHPDNWASCR
ncbi:hypothetical protein [Nocardia sp. NBC_01377]|uniref:hypothetical protein n=1 Tax=Nocardia sp. NBC_01377 TaxID=2903595 RepID=UPI0038706620